MFDKNLNSEPCKVNYKFMDSVHCCFFYQVRKKTAKLIEMEEADKLEKKIAIRKTDIIKPGIKKQKSTSRKLLEEPMSNSAQSDPIDDGFQPLIVDVCGNYNMPPEIDRPPVKLTLTAISLGGAIEPTTTTKKLKRANTDSSTADFGRQMNDAMSSDDSGAQLYHHVSSSDQQQPGAIKMKFGLSPSERPQTGITSERFDTESAEVRWQC